MNQSSREPTTRLLTQLVLSLLRDVLIPFVYTFIVGPLSTCIQSREVNQLLSYPIRWPIIILQNLIPLRASRVIDGTDCDGCCRPVHSRA